MFPARKWTWIAQSKVKCTNQEILLVALCYRNRDKLWPNGAFICLPTYLHVPTKFIHTGGELIMLTYVTRQLSGWVHVLIFCTFLQLPCYMYITVTLLSPLLSHSDFYPWVLFHHTCRSTQLGNANLTIQQTFWILLFWYMLFNFHFLH